jgi:hemoglobin-like flavoprotein
MPQRRIELIEASYQQITPLSSVVGEKFYDRLFEIAPELRQLFDGSFPGPGGKFRVISQVVERHLRALVSQPVTPRGEKPPILPAIMELGRRHADLPITSEHFDKMKEALLSTLEEVLGENLRYETRECWSSAYDGVADMILRAMEIVRSEREAEKAANALRDASPGPLKVVGGK